jgi:hypothetical protein
MAITYRLHDLVTLTARAAGRATGAERRAHPRVRVRAEATLASVGDIPIAGVTSNVSLGGASVELPARRSLREVAAAAAVSIDSGGLEIRLPASVVGTDVSPAGSVGRVRVRFGRLSDADRDGLTALIDQRQPS